MDTRETEANIKKIQALISYYYVKGYPDSNPQFTQMEEMGLILPGSSYFKGRELSQQWEAEHPIPQVPWTPIPQVPWTEGDPIQYLPITVEDPESWEARTHLANLTSNLAELTRDLHNASSSQLN